MSLAPDIISSPYTSELSKVYGSVLQPKETLKSFHCHFCYAAFTPDATIYPDPSGAAGERYMCRTCFSQNGGSRGNCVECARPVLILKSEGGFIENAGHVWHKRCFHCLGCSKNIGDNPMVDLLGRPSCAECFDTCLDRGDSSGKLRARAPTTKDDVDCVGGFKSTSIPNSGKARKGSSTIEELDASAPKSWSPSSPVSFPYDGPGRSALPPPKDIIEPSRQSSTPPRSTARSPTKVTPEAIEAVKRRFLKQVDSPLDKHVHVHPPRLDVDASETPTKSSMRYSDFRLLRHKGSASSMRTDRDSMLSLSSAASTPSLTSDHSDTATISSRPSSPPSLNGEQEDLASLLSSSPPLSLSGRSINPASLNTRTSDPTSETFNVYTKPLVSNRTYVHSPPPDARCAKCYLPLFDVIHGGKYVSVPEPSSAGSLPRTYHADCFRCRICNGLFEEKETGRAVFVRGVRGACHLDCAPAERTASLKPLAANPVLSASRPSETLSRALREHFPSTSPPSATSATTRLSSRYSAPLQFAANAPNPMPRFGTSTSCPGCFRGVSPMERGVVPGPQGQRWHSSCLVCGGKQAKGRGGRRVNGQPGCGKQLDSSAKRDIGAGGVWCRDCLLLLPYELRSSEASPTRSSPLKHKEHDSAVDSGQFDRIASQHTGSTTIARQFTGLSGGGAQQSNKSCCSIHRWGFERNDSPTTKVCHWDER
ncbi:hypothetical protein B0F90DRAFT_63605 [Multifurca ochricompacta]|uniref:LIM zinc-binding domain-containing protein n=1 Tax=Multifurca ochricompacta TaxID=376703 RepID=A0AAD4QTV4_9AGAM|nr:hypothetical protein B0F90DRAFT_63605 [Multifurca ochricompacta]